MKVRIRTVENVYPLKRVNLVPRSARLIRHLLELTKPWNAGSKSPATGLFIYLFVCFFFFAFFRRAPHTCPRSPDKRKK